MDIYIRIGIRRNRSIRSGDIIVYHQSWTNEWLFEVQGLFATINLIELHYSQKSEHQEEDGGDTGTAGHF